jgi:hypothetical protein
VLLLAAPACAEETPPLALAMPDPVLFQTEVYPVLLRDCGFNACHGSTERFFQVVGPGRLRLSPMTDVGAETTPEEIQYSYERARSMIDPYAPESSLLLRKPLAVDAGGAGHEGVDEYGRDVYQSKMELGYMTLARWVLGAPPLVPQP